MLVGEVCPEQQQVRLFCLLLHRDQWFHSHRRNRRAIQQCWPPTTICTLPFRNCRGKPGMPNKRKCSRKLLWKLVLRGHSTLVQKMRRFVEDSTTLSRGLKRPRLFTRQPTGLPRLRKLLSTFARNYAAESPTFTLGSKFTCCT